MWASRAYRLLSRGASRRGQGTRRGAARRVDRSHFSLARNETRAYRTAVRNDPRRGPGIAAWPMLNGHRGAPGRKLMLASSSYIAARLLPLRRVPDSAGHRVMNPLCAVPRFLRLFRFVSPPVPLTLFLSLRGSHERHLMKCHRCPTDRRAKCRRLLIPRLGEPSDFDFTRNAAKMTP